MKSQFEIDNKLDFENCDPDRRLKALRLFAEAAPFLLAQTVDLGRCFQADAAETSARVHAAATTDEALAAMTECAGAYERLSAQFLDLINQFSFGLGRELAKLGVRPVTAPPHHHQTMRAAHHGKISRRAN
jgi:hypothetical protein